MEETKNFNWEEEFFKLSDDTDDESLLDDYDLVDKHVKETNFDFSKFVDNLDLSKLNKKQKLVLSNFILDYMVTDIDPDLLDVKYKNILSENVDIMLDDLDEYDKNFKEQEEE